ncbi:MAG: hypothetical protein ABW034_12065 [Steroidobacteraceae bacterium]
MQPSAAYVSLKIFSYIVLVLMVGAIGYSAAIAIVHWSGIGV